MDIFYTQTHIFIFTSGKEMIVSYAVLANEVGKGGE
jgi:hypothetical protein